VNVDRDDANEINYFEDYYTVTRQKDFKGFGITIAYQKDEQLSATVPTITGVESGSPADSAGLKTADRIVEINGKSIISQKKDTLEKSIKKSGDEFQVKIRRYYKSDEYASAKIEREPQQVDKKSPAYTMDSSFDENSQSIQRADSLNLRRSRSASPKIIESTMTLSSSKIYNPSPEVRPRNLSEPPPLVSSDESPVPRLCRIRATEASLGFQVSGSKSNRGVFKVTDIVPKSPADDSGLKNDDHIIEVSGMNVESLDYADLVKLIKEKKNEDDLQLLVVDRKALDWYRQKKLAISSNSIFQKVQYIETLYPDEMQFNLTDSINAVHKISQESLNTLERK
jgi:predicted metalloprotease with PDZ domain